MFKLWRFSFLVSLSAALDLKVSNSTECADLPITLEFKYVCDDESLCSLGQSEKIVGTINYDGLRDAVDVSEDSIFYFDAFVRFSISGYKTIEQPLVDLYPVSLCLDDNRDQEEQNGEEARRDCLGDGSHSDFDVDFTFPNTMSDFVSWAATGYKAKVVVDIYLDSTSTLAGTCTVDIETRRSNTTSTSKMHAVVKSLPSGRIGLIVSLTILGLLVLCRILVSCWRTKRLPEKELLLIEKSEQEDERDNAGLFKSRFLNWIREQKKPSKDQSADRDSIQAEFNRGMFFFSSRAQKKRQNDQSADHDSLQAEFERSAGKCPKRSRRFWFPRRKKQRDIEMGMTRGLVFVAPLVTYDPPAPVPDEHVTEEVPEQGRPPQDPDTITTQETKPGLLSSRFEAWKREKKERQKSQPSSERNSIQVERDDRGAHVFTRKSPASAPLPTEAPEQPPKKQAPKQAQNPPQALRSIAKKETLPKLSKASFEARKREEKDRQKTKPSADRDSFRVKRDNGGAQVSIGKSPASAPVPAFSKVSDPAPKQQPKKQETEQPETPPQKRNRVTQEETIPALSENRFEAWKREQKERQKTKPSAGRDSIHVVRDDRGAHVFTCKPLASVPVSPEAPKKAPKQQQLPEQPPKQQPPKQPERPPRKVNSIMREKPSVLPGNPSEAWWKREQPPKKQAPKQAQNPPQALRSIAKKETLPKLSKASFEARKREEKDRQKTKPSADRDSFRVKRDNGGAQVSTGKSPASAPVPAFSKVSGPAPKQQPKKQETEQPETPPQKRNRVTQEETIPALSENRFEAWKREQKERQKTKPSAGRDSIHVVRDDRGAHVFTRKSPTPVAPEAPKKAPKQQQLPEQPPKQQPPKQPERPPQKVNIIMQEEPSVLSGNPFGALWKREQKEHQKTESPADRDSIYVARDDHGAHVFTRKSPSPVPPEAPKKAPKQQLPEQPTEPLPPKQPERPPQKRSRIAQEETTPVLPENQFEVWKREQRERPKKPSVDREAIHAVCDRGVFVFTSKTIDALIDQECPRKPRRSITQNESGKQGVQRWASIRQKGDLSPNTSDPPGVTRPSKQDVSVKFTNVFHANRKRTSDPPAVKRPSKQNVSVEFPNAFYANRKRKGLRRIYHKKEYDWESASC